MPGACDKCWALFFNKNRKRLCNYKIFFYICENIKNQLVMAKDKQVTIEDLTFDDKNFNKHTEFGLSLLEKSLRNNGAGRSILIDKNNRIIGGYGVVEVAGQIGLNKVRVIETDGTEIVAVKRTDIDLDSKQGREMALADNATASADLEWDAEVLAEVTDEYDIELNDWGVFLDDEDEIKSAPRDNTKGFVKITLMLTDNEADELERLCAKIDDTQEVAILEALRNYGTKDNT